MAVSRARSATGNSALHGAAAAHHAARVVEQRRARSRGKQRERPAAGVQAAALQAGHLGHIYGLVQGQGAVGGEGGRVVHGQAAYLAGPAGPRYLGRGAVVRVKVIRREAAGARQLNGPRGPGGRNAGRVADLQLGAGLQLGAARAAQHQAVGDELAARERARW